MTIAESLNMFGRIKQMELRLEGLSTSHKLDVDECKLLTDAIDILNECACEIESHIVTLVEEG